MDFRGGAYGLGEYKGYTIANMFYTNWDTIDNYEVTQK